MSNTPFENLSKKIKEIDIEGETLLIKPKTKDVAAFLSMGDKMTEVEAMKLASIFENMISRAYTMQKIEFEKEDIEDYVAEHFGHIMYKVMEIFGFATKEEIDKLKKKSMSKMGEISQ